MIDIETVRSAAHRLLNSRDGEVVLEYLCKLYDGPFKDEHLERQVGRRDVVLELRRLKEKRDEK